jgi:hypothetical protein
LFIPKSAKNKIERKLVNGVNPCFEIKTPIKPKETTMSLIWS